MTPADELSAMTGKTQLFVLFYLATGGRVPKWAARKAGFVGDMSKRTSALLNRPYVQQFLKKYQCAAPSGIELTRESLMKKLAQIASGQLVKINTSDVLKAVELIGKSLGVWEGSNQEGRDRLREVLAAFTAGAVPVETAEGKEPTK